MSGRRGEQVERKQCCLRTSNTYFVAVIWASGSSSFWPCMLPWCCAAGLRSLGSLHPAGRGRETAPRSWCRRGGAVAQISLCKVQHSLIGSVLHCVLGITAGICLGRERGGGREREREKARTWAGTEIKREHSILLYILETVASFPPKTNQFHPMHHMQVLLKLKGKKAT